MTDEARSLEQTARDLYGGEYHEDPRSEPVRREAHNAAEGLSMESALERLRESREVSPEPPQERAPAESRHEPAQADDGALWTSDEAEVLGTFKAEAAQLQHDLVLFDKARQIDLGEIEKQDRGRAQALRTQLREAEQELLARHERLQGVAQQIQATAESRQQERIERHLERERQELERRVPDFNRDALVPYLRRVGFTDAEIGQVADSRLVEMAWKAHQWDQLQQQGGKRPGKVVRKKQQRTEAPRPRGKVADARTRFQKTRSIHDAAALLTAQRESNNGR